MVSLNGSYGSIDDGVDVSIDSYDGIFVIVSSTFIKYDDNLFIITYRCKDIDNKLIDVPSNMISIYVPPEV